MMQFSDSDNTIFQQAASFVNYTNRHIFLTGKAGTGKTTFLKYIKEHCYKRLAIVAPTGVAAINASGVTIHSLFQLPFGMYVPALQFQDNFSSDNSVYNKHQLLDKLKLNKVKREILQELELLIVDEVSMLRCDTLDAMDAILRHIRRAPNKVFGGVQMLFIGDLFQLPPVVSEHENALLNRYYETPFFFSALALQEQKPVCIELSKVYRQSDEQFIALLNRIRNNETDDDDLSFINQFYHNDFIPHKDENYITLTSHNSIASRINQQALNQLNSKLCEFEAEINGEFSERMYPNDKTISLKEGAQIMFIKNDKGEDRKYFNGKIGTIESIDKEKNILIRFPDEKDLLELRKEEWKNIQYKYDKTTDKIDEEEIGSFLQYPIRLAWAITIHKSQGLTFDKAVIDAGSAFAAGQVYVAFSRLRSLKGLILRSKIYRSAIYTDKNVLSFSDKTLLQNDIKNLLQDEQLQFIHQSIIQTFDWRKMYHKLNDYILDESQKLFKEEDNAEAFLKTILEKLQTQTETADKFIRQLKLLIDDAKENSYNALKQRLDKACEWFDVSLENEIILPLKEEIVKIKERKLHKKLQTQLSDLLIPFERKKQELKSICKLVYAMCESENINDWLGLLNKKEAILIEEKFVPEKKLQKGETYNVTLNLFKEGISIDEICRQRNLAKSTIEGHLTRFVETGEIDISIFLSKEDLEKINEYVAQHPTNSSSEIRTAFNEQYSYAQLNAAAAYRRKAK